MDARRRVPPSMHLSRRRPPLRARVSPPFSAFHLVHWRTLRKDARGIDLKLTLGCMLGTVNIFHGEKMHERMGVMAQKIRLALIMGSNREGRLSDTVTRWVVKQIARRSEFLVDVIDPLELSLPPRIERDDSAPVLAFRERIQEADAFIVVTPEYNHGYPAPLKAMIDHADEEWYAKPVAFVSYGGISGGLRAVEQLRLVFAELHAVAIRDTVSFHFAWNQFDADGEPVQREAAEAAMTTLLDRLAWWADALTRAREATPYVQARA